MGDTAGGYVYTGMNSVYFLGNLSEGAAMPELHVAPAMAASGGVAVSRIMPTSLHSFRSSERRRKQTVRSEQELDTLYRAWDARRQEAEMEGQLAAGQKQAAEEARNVRHARQAATLQKQAARAEQQRQQVQALEATRTKHKGSAAAARRAKLDATVEVQALKKKSNESLSHFAPVPKVALRRRTSGSSSSSSGHANSEGSTRQASNLKGRMRASPSTPAKECVKSMPGSPITAGSLLDTVAAGTTLGRKNQPGPCRFCHTACSSTWRIGKVQAYVKQHLCNACGIWEDRHGSLTACNKAGKSRQAVLAKKSQTSAAGRKVLPMLEAQALSGAEQGEDEVVGMEDKGEDEMVGMEDKGGRVAQRQVRRQGSALSSCAGGQNVQQQQQQQEVRHLDEGSGTDAVPTASRKRAASSSLVQHSAKRGQVQADIGEGAAVAAEGDTGVVDGAGSHAADASAFGVGSKQTAVNGGSQRLQQRKVLRIRK